MPFQNFEQFWPFYVGQHLNRTNRRLHFAGTTAAFLVLFHLAIVIWPAYDTLLGGLWLGITVGTHIVSALVVGYGCAWAGHFFFEKNKPATFTYPLWSFRGDMRMYGLMWRRRMDGEIIRFFPQQYGPNVVSFRR